VLVLTRGACDCRMLVTVFVVLLRLALDDELEVVWFFLSLSSACRAEAATNKHAVMPVVIAT
jgi:hypothetical protein